ncbi:hypothetical protein BDM02DRAFT_252881 [Thelephora ganbajun]|uniref:Uncharacterized protein n=1 Tax=Thelephora ganbajun TaxID=370292 RepID=A0ACB6ZAC8_THEGA|nr:hypothetical protein BDM02DRAFT_252881 [Thelephora ganbajun]
MVVSMEQGWGCDTGSEEVGGRQKEELQIRKVMKRLRLFGRISFQLSVCFPGTRESSPLGHVKKEKSLRKMLMQMHELITTTLTYTSAFLHRAHLISEHLKTFVRAYSSHSLYLSLSLDRRHGATSFQGGTPAAHRNSERSSGFFGAIDTHLPPAGVSKPPGCFGIKREACISAVPVKRPHCN